MQRVGIETLWPEQDGAALKKRAAKIKCKPGHVLRALWKLYGHLVDDAAVLAIRDEGLDVQRESGSLGGRPVREKPTKQGETKNRQRT